MTSYVHKLLIQSIDLYVESYIVLACLRVYSMSFWEILMLNDG